MFHFHCLSLDSAKPQSRYLFLLDTLMMQNEGQLDMPKLQEKLCLFASRNIPKPFSKILWKEMILFETLSCYIILLEPPEPPGLVKSEFEKGRLQLRFSESYDIDSTRFWV